MLEFIISFFAQPNYDEKRNPVFVKTLLLFFLCLALSPFVYLVFF